MEINDQNQPLHPIPSGDTHRQLPWLAVTLSLLVLGVLGVLGYQNILLKKQLSQSAQMIPVSTPSPTCRPRPACLDATPRCLIPITADMCPSSPPPDISSDSGGISATESSTADWTTYQGEAFYTIDGPTSFQIKYPAEWEIEKNILYPLGRLEDKGLETRIVLGAGGHGWSGKVEKKIFPAGEANYSWVNSGQQISAFASFEKNKQMTYIIEIVNLPSTDEKEYKALFDQILSTFKFLD